MTDSKSPASAGYAFAETAAGTALVAVGRDGVAAILLGSDRDRLLAEARSSLPGGVGLVPDDGTRGAAEAVAAIIAEPDAQFGHALDLRGSPVELAVWRALQAIPAGTTTTYGAIAKGLGVPATAQEVGAACAANRIAVAVPCHRVLKADGSISGYRWGVHRKRRLLELEAAA